MFWLPVVVCEAGSTRLMQPYPFGEGRAPSLSRCRWRRCRNWVGCCGPDRSPRSDSRLQSPGFGATAGLCARVNTENRQNLCPRGAEWKARDLGVPAVLLGGGFCGVLAYHLSAAQLVVETPVQTCHNRHAGVRSSES